MTVAAVAPLPRLDADQSQPVKYCIPLWLRDEQIKLAISRPIPRIQPHFESRPEPLAIVCYGPSLNDTWEQIQQFPFVMSCSGAHRFLIDRGILPTWHVAVDPLPRHTVGLIGQPHAQVEYLISSTCHPDVFDHLQDFNLKLWHVFDSAEDAIRTLPYGEWALTGGSSVGLRAMTIAAFMGFRHLHLFAMDGSAGKSGTHAGEHPMQQTKRYVCEYPKGSAVDWYTTPSMLQCARETWHELDQMPGVTAQFYGEGLVQEMAKHYVPKPALIPKGLVNGIAMAKAEVISAEYRDLNKQLHRENLAYGVGGGKHAETVLKIVEAGKVQSVLDYGCGKGYLAKALPFPIWEYDPAIPGKDQAPRPADLVVCTDVLEHIEPSKLLYVLHDLHRCTRTVGFLVIHTGAAQKNLPDGRNTHLIQHGKVWWAKKLERFFSIAKIVEKGPELHIIVAPKR